MNTERKERRGFASMSPEKQREIASKGGRAAHEKGTAHEWTADEARKREEGCRSVWRRGRFAGRGTLVPWTTARRSRVADRSCAQTFGGTTMASA